MPVWYTGVLDEHNAVRKAAGLFDVSHMGVFEVSGPHADEFLDLVLHQLRPLVRAGRELLHATCSTRTAR